MASEELERQKAFQELQNRAQTTFNVLQQVMQQEHRSKVAKQRLELVLKDLGEMPADTTMYQQIGRAYFMQPRAAVLEASAEEIKTAATDIELNTKRKLKMQGQLKELEQEMHELAAGK
mmetsp:Transcript_25690/g.56220  ORF Transcript_25690/g.56220 Transcript_25690/m.56220 type:complete len:119 (+) Transcript_25690:32-388(+)